MTYPNNEMEPTIEEELAKERRTRFLDRNNPAVKELWDGIKTTIQPALKPGVNVDLITESLVINALRFAYKDQLSGLPTRSRLTVELEAAAAVAKRINIPLSVLFIDGEDFKSINDNISHDVGDQVITATGEALALAARRSTDFTLNFSEEEVDVNSSADIAGRHGGDEFVAILLGTDLNGARVVAERFNQLIAQTVDEKVPVYRQRFNHPFGVTIGMAQLDASIDEDGKDVLKRADEDLNKIRASRGQTRRS